MNQNQEIIEKLEKLYALLDEAYNANEYAKSGCTREYSAKISPVIKTVNDLNGIPSVFSSLPTFPIDNTETDELEQSFFKLKKRFSIVLLITIICIVIYFIADWNFLNTVSVIGIFASIFFGCSFSAAKNKYKTAKKKYEDSQKVYEDSMKAFENSLSIYESEKANGIEKAKQFANEYKEAYVEYDRLLQELEEKRKEAFQTFIQKVDEAKTYDFMPSEYYDLIKPVIKLLKSGRADNYKEALNLAIQEQKEAEAEAARRAEEAERTRIMREQAEAEERRALEEQRHRQQMELNEAAARRAAEADAERARREAKNEERRRKSEEETRKFSGRQRCKGCANWGACTPAAKENGLTCGAFVPKRY